MPSFCFTEQETDDASIASRDGENIVRQESKFPTERSRVWLSEESHKILNKGEGSKTMEGLALDMEMEMLDKQKFAFKSSNLKTDALQKMDRLKLLQLNFVQLTGTYGNFSEDLRWLCWLGSNLRTIPSDLFMGNLVAIDMSYSKLEVFELPMVLQSLQILNLTHSHDLCEIRNMSMIPQLETLILWNCHSLARVCETIGELTNLALLNMTGCKSLCKSEQRDQDLEASTSGGEVTEQPTFSFSCSLHRLFLKDCNLECTDSFPLSFSTQPCLEYLNLGYSLFQFLPCYDHLKSLRVLDVSSCSMLKRLPCLPSTLAELYIYYCKSLEEINFQSHRFTLQEFGYEGCISLLEIEGFIKLVPITKLEGNDLGHMKWLKEYQNHEVCLVGDDELTKGRSFCLQMLYEFHIMSTSLPDMEDPNMKSTYVSESSSLSFDVPPPPKNKRLKGIDVTFKYTISGDDDWVWFCKINTTNGVDLMYNPKVFGKPESDEVGIWLSYWPIGNTLDIGDKVNVSIAVINGLEVHECGVSLVYTDEKVAEDTLEDNMEWIEVLGGDLSGFQLSTQAYYLCRRDLFELMEIGRLTPGWFSILVGDTIECTEVRGWRKTGRPMQLNPSFTELKFVRCIMHGPESEEIYKIAEMSKSSIVDSTLEFTSSLLGETMKSSTLPKSRETKIKMKQPNHVMIPFQAIEDCTQGFNKKNFIGKGRYVSVYKGILTWADYVNKLVAVKRLDDTGFQGNKDFNAEVSLHSQYKHKNIVNLIGFCDDKNEMILVYEYTSHGSLEEYLLHTSVSGGLSWPQLLNICIDVASAVDYLHNHVAENYRIIHGDIKSAKVLLDENWNAKLSDFGLCRIVLKSQNNFAGTQGYCDPQYERTGFLTKESDVFSFGVVLFEVLCGRLACVSSYHDERRFLHHFARTCYQNGAMDKIIDNRIKKDIKQRMLSKFSAIAYQCLQENREERPTIAEVVFQLKEARKIQLESEDEDDE
ncbi:uncharacterized protein LOC111909382 [Lactuca sativa]|uniref:Protein kinase domain-containing protein n=1 Tax=Lactuca sativa TaxID=4236 RepID=A0A9R1XUY1_LACSA|nr:uncharacterized protein LOC111909382 [Lactuca sativa]KAJ0226569.1 hypothetical protein LSAT_V11C100037290 [Lactuca sativa]